MNCGKSCNCTVFHLDTIKKVEEKLISNDEINLISNLFKVLSDFTRVKILKAIESEFLCVCDLAHVVGVTKSGISHQMKLLKKYHMVKEKKEGKMVYYKVSNPYIVKLLDDVHQFIKGENHA